MYILLICPLETFVVGLGTDRPASVVNRGWLMRSCWMVRSVGVLLRIGGTSVVRSMFLGTLLIVYCDLLS